MQANNDPKWTDDAAFWNEAWADMNKRLDDKQPPNRKAAVVWWRNYGWLAALLLLVVAVATPSAMAYLSQDEATEQELNTPMVPLTPTSKLPVVIADNDHKSANRENQAQEEGAIEHAARFPETLAASSEIKTLQANTSNATSKQAPLTVIPVEKGDPGMEGTLTVSPLDATALVDQAGTTILNTPTTESNIKEVPAPLTSLIPQPIGAIEFAQRQRTDQLAIVVKKPKLASRLYLDAGISEGLRGNNTGFYAGLGYNVPISKRFSIPVSFHFRKDFHNFKELAESGTPARFLENSDITTGSSVPDTILITFSEDNIDAIVSTSFEGRIGFTYSPAPRWQIGTSASLNYLLTANALTSSQYRAAFASPQGNNTALDTNIELVNGLSSSRVDASLASPGSLTGEAVGSLSGFPKFDHWVFHAGLNVSYDLTRKLTLTMAGRRLISQPDQVKVVGLQRGQLEIGARWRLK
ncbi:hypothetical protein [Neolewinella persica]|uniref:hypothetical protein n=1 Tax=Neolewinella persica TaxID=70998 RepID=UPI00037C95DB|nr:hypothetical protein [Neolewinella persica]